MASSSSTKEMVLLQRADVAKFTPEQVSFKPCNYLSLVDIPEDRPQFKEGATFIKVCPLMYAFVHRPVAVTADLQAFWYTAHCTEVTTERGTKLPAIGFQIPEHGYFAFTTGVLRRALKIPSKAKTEQWASEPTSGQLAEFLDSIGYEWENPETKVIGSKCEKRRLCARWQYIFTQVIQCLGSKSGSQDQASKHFQDLVFALCTNYKLNFADYIFSDMYNRVGAAKREKWIPYPRFVATIIGFLVGDEYTKDSNQSFSMVGKKSLDIDATPGDAPYTPYMLELIRSATPVTTSLQIPTASIPVTTSISSPPKRKQPGTGHKKSVAHKPPFKRQRKEISQQALLSDEGLPPTPPSTTATTTPFATSMVSAVAASSALPPTSSATLVFETLVGSYAEAVLGNTITAFSSISLSSSLVRTATHDSELAVPISDEVATHAI